MGNGSAIQPADIPGSCAGGISAAYLNVPSGQSGPSVQIGVQIQLGVGQSTPHLDYLLEALVDLQCSSSDRSINQERRRQRSICGEGPEIVGHRGA